MVPAAVMHYNQAMDLERKGHYAEAVKEYQESIRLDPTDADAYVRVGLLLRELGRDEEANRAFESALGLKAPRSPGPSSEPTWKPDLGWSDPVGSSGSGTIES
jgi:Flp pilus assembly protein TadD